MRTYFLLLALCFIYTTIIAQKVDTRWGKVSKDELNLEECAFDTAASAVMLFDVGKLHFRSGYAIIERHIRIKILDNTALDYANVTLPYVYQEGRETIKNIKAQTINSVDGKAETIEVKNNQIFDDKQDEYWAQVRFALPSVRPGSIIEYKYDFYTQNLYFIKPWFFQNEIPTVLSELRAEPPSYLSYNIVKFGKQMQQTRGENNQWTLRELPGYKSEPFIFYPKDYAEQIHFQLLSYEKQRTPIEGGGLETVNVLQDWDKLGAEVLDQCDYYFNSRKSLATKVQEMTADAKTDEEKVQQIYDYVTGNYKWNNYWGIQPQQNMNELQKKQEGNSAELNLLLIAMLKEAGFIADPILISTRHHGKVIQSFPLLSQFNHLVTYLELAGKPYFLDAAFGTTGQPFHLLPREDLNFRGFVLRKKAFEWIKIEPTKDSQTNSVLKIDLAEEKGSVQFRYKGYPAIDALQQWHANKTTYTPFKNQPEIGDQLFDLKNPSTEPSEMGVFDYTFDFTLETAEQNYLYFSPLSWSRFSEVPLKSQERTFPLELDYPFTDNLSISIALSDAYQIESMPENANIILPDGVGKFIYNASVLSNQLNITVQVSLKQTIFAAETYPLVKAFYEEVNKKLGEFIVIKKQ